MVEDIDDEEEGRGKGGDWIKKSQKEEDENREGRGSTMEKEEEERRKIPMMNKKNYKKTGRNRWRRLGVGMRKKLMTNRKTRMKSVR